MNVAVLNGSPRGEKSNTGKITAAFLEGLEEAGEHTVTRIDVYRREIKPCLGCFACWKDTPGLCVIMDDMQDILPVMVEADLIIWGFPLYYYGMPSQLKALMDRLLPLNLPFMAMQEDGSVSHPGRFDLSHQHSLVISTSGFASTKNNYESVEAQFGIAFGTGQYSRIFCPEGELFSIPELRERTGAYLETVRRAGREFTRAMSIPLAIQAELDTLLLPAETYNKLADASWGLPPSPQETKTDTGTGAGDSSNVPEPGEAGDPSSTLVRQMAALYNPAPLGGKEALLELAFTDLGVTHRLFLGARECTVLDGEDLLPESVSIRNTTRIETPFSVWTQISKGELDGAKAMMEGKYTVNGNFDLMLNMDGLFSGPSAAHTPEAAPAGASVPVKKPNLALVILPWMPLWITLPRLGEEALYPVLGVLILSQLAGFKWLLGRHEYLTFALTAAAAAAAAAGVPPALLLPASYLAFGAHWLTSSLFPIPLTAWYSASAYGGEDALKNALFIKTNRIITAVWGVFYLATAAWTVFLLRTTLAPFAGTVNAAIPLLCGIWTAWFQKWYPAKVARG